MPYRARLVAAATVFMIITSTQCFAAKKSNEPWYVIATSVNLRNLPNDKAQIIAGLPISTKVEVYDVADRNGVSPPDGEIIWSRIRVLSGNEKGKVGWISTEFLVPWMPTISLMLEEYDRFTKCVTDVECKAAKVIRLMWAERAIALEPMNKDIRRHVTDVFPHPFVDSIKKGDLEQVKQLVRDGWNINEDITGRPGPEENRGVTPLLAALFSDQPDIARYLLEQGANPNDMATFGMGEDRYTPLTIAVSKGYKDIVSLLIIKGANLNTCASTAGGNNGTPLIRAITKQYREITKLLIEKGADVNALGCVYGGTASTTLCVATPYPDTVRLLLSHNADINRMGEDGHTPLICAIRINAAESILLLLEAGANPNLQDSQGLTALMHMIISTSTDKQLDMLKLLLSHGAKLDLRDKRGRTVEILEKEYRTTIVHGFLKTRVREQ